MKKILFFFVFILLFVPFFILKKDTVIDKKINDYNVIVNYPYFTSNNVNSYINGYISKNIISNDSKLIIDYDYNDKNKILTFYKTKINNNIINTKINTFEVKKNSLIKVKNIKNVNDYDFYNNKSIDKNTKLIAFTFDDGPNYNTSSVIDTLVKYNVTATFFVMGKNIKGNEKIIKKMYDSGMEIGNHTFNHLLLTKYSSEKIEEEIANTNDLIFEITGRYPSLLRTSYGSVNKKVKQLANMPIIIWDIDTLDWKYKNSNRIANRILNKVNDGDIILMHDIYKSTLNSLDIVIPALIERGFQIVSVSELFYYKDIDLENGKVYGFAK